MHLWSEHVSLLLSQGAGIHIGKHVTSLYFYNGDWLKVPIVFLVRRSDVAKLLFRVGEDPNTTDSSGDTDLEFSAEHFRTIDEMSWRKKVIDAYS